ncbi:MAG: CHASE3 domain-containing protein, partial [Chitinophagaceae bacterium]
VKFISYNRIISLNETNASIAHNKEVNLRLNQILISLLNAETGQRGFLLTHDSDFLKPFIGSQEKINKIVDSLEISLATDSTQRRNLEVLKSLVETRYKIFAILPQRLIDEDSIPADRSKYLNNGRSAMGHARNLIAQMSNYENKALANKTPSRDQVAFITPFYSLLFSIIGILIVTFAYFRLKREIQLRVIAENNLNDMNRELSLNNAELSSFSYVASHDLQEPLRKIQSFGNLIINQEKENLSEKGKDYMVRINNAAARMQELIIALLSYSSTNVKNISFVPISLDKILKHAKENLSDIIEAKNVQIESQPLPEVEGVEIQVAQVFSNILSNAIKYAKNDEPCKIVITVEKTQIGDNVMEKYLNQQYWKIGFHDNGIGFDQKYAQRIFELFQRLHGREQYAGTGIGLALCQKIMLNHKGFITARSEPGIGATFELYFPEK